MSRMIAWVAREPVALRTAIGTPGLEAFASLARLHAEGWGIALGSGSEIEATTSIAPFTLDLHARLMEQPATVGLLYLRFASRGASPSPADAQPFTGEGLAFAHNGAFDRDLAVRLLSESASAKLHGSSDSEVYFAMVREGLRDGAAPQSGLANAARSLRTVAPDACLNAMLLTPNAVHVARSTAGRPAPIASFAARGWHQDQLPIGHGAEYNELRAAETRQGVRVIATTGFPQAGWSSLTDEVVATITPDTTTIMPLETP